MGNDKPAIQDDFLDKGANLRLRGVIFIMLLSYS
jgi:hypothetical protein